MLIEHDDDGTINVLLIDDDETFLDLATRVLKEKQPLIMIETALDGKSALDIMEKQSFDAIFLSHVLPDIAGHEILEKARQDELELPIVIITGHSLEKVTIYAVNLGVSYYIIKGETLINHLSEFSKIITTSVNLTNPWLME